VVVADALLVLQYQGVALLLAEQVVAAEVQVIQVELR
jgi:hypothetical protein